jgi:hypothetical protein
VRVVSWNTPNTEDLRVKIQSFTEQNIFKIEEYKQYLNEENKKMLNSYVKRMTRIKKPINLGSYKREAKLRIYYKHKMFKMTNYIDNYDECVIEECSNESLNYDKNDSNLNYTLITDNDRKNEVLNYYLKDKLICELLLIDGNSIRYSTEIYQIQVFRIIQRVVILLMGVNHL